MSTGSYLPASNISWAQLDEKTYSRSSIKQESTSFEGDVTDFFQKLSAEQEPLGREFEQVLFDNLWDLYQS